MKLTLEQARNYLICLHFGPHRQALMDHMHGLRSVQFDPLDVVGRNADLVLQSRINRYKPAMLYDTLYKDRLLMDGFDKCLCIYPIEEYPHFARMREIEWGPVRSPEIAEAYPHVCEQIRLRGPLCSDDLALDAKVDWPWGPTKLSRAVLEHYWAHGKLILSHKKGVRRYYDLIERYVPESILSAPNPHGSDAAFYEWMLMRRIDAVGLMWNRASDAFVAIPGFSQAVRNRSFEALEASGQIVRVEIEGIAWPLFLPARDVPVFEASLTVPVDKTMRFIAPLDNLIWDRKLIEVLFGFYYRWEVYTPKDKREYGYYVLPVLYGGRFVARFEPEHFRGGKLIIRNWWWEVGIRRTKAIALARERALKAFCRYLGADGYLIETEHEPQKRPER